MAFELITGHAGKNHVDSADMGEAFAGIVGKGRYILDTGQGMACTMTDSNTLRVGTGSMLMDGRIVRNETAATFKIANGTQGQYRHDLACLRYTLDRSNDSIESVTPVVLQGTAASSESAAKDPSYTAGDILSGDLTAIVPIARVKLAGLTPTCEKLLSSVTSLKSLGESVSREKYPKVICGSAVRDAKNFNAVMLFSDEQFKEVAGRAFNNAKDCISVMNADGNASSAIVMGTIYDPRTKHLDVHLSGTTNAIRLNYIIALGA